ncbi:MAG: hypothetical protein H6Q60_970 [Oscillospiraceae bacterium]|nr:hypothetical protein [Oscillospiraceae bacterium]
MGFFTSKDTRTESEDGVCDCKLCGVPLSSDNFSNDLGLCDGCLIQTKSFLKNYYLPGVEKYRKLAEEETNIEDQISYLRDLLDVLYTYKVRYYDQEIDFLDQDIDDLIDDLVDQISRARG